MKVVRSALKCRSSICMSIRLSFAKVSVIVSFVGFMVWNFFNVFWVFIFSLFADVMTRVVNS